MIRARQAREQYYFHQTLEILAVSQQEFEQIFPADGQVEHRPGDIWETVVQVGRETISKAEALGCKITAIGITNQRETTLVWDRRSGEVVYNAIVWQDRRTAKQCKELQDSGGLDIVRHKSGLLLDPYFSATKIVWILDNVEGARAHAEKGELCFGTVDSFLIWQMTGGARHVTDATNASRTSLYNIREGQWDEELCQLFNVPMSMLPAVQDSASHFGDCLADIFGLEVPIYGVGRRSAGGYNRAGLCKKRGD